MPTTRRRTKRVPKVAVPDHLERYFATGERSILVYVRDEHGRDFLEIWAEIKESYLARWCERSPFTRPFIFYYCRSEGRGKPKSMWSDSVGKGKTKRHDESELQFLQRHDLLTDTEKQLLTEDSRYNKTSKQGERYQ